MNATTPLSLRRIVPLALVLGGFVLLQGCSDDEKEPEQCRSASGPVSVAPTCSADANAKARTNQAEAFRTHVAASSTAAGIAFRQLNGVTAWLMSCVAEAVVDVVVGAFTGQDPGPPKCASWEQSASYVFDAGTYRMDLRQKVAWFGTSIVDEENSAALRFVFTKPVAGNAEGALVPYDLGRADTYLVGMRLVSAGDKVSIAYDRPGPLVELLGLGPNPPNPITVTKAAVETMRQSMSSSLALEGTTRAKLGDCGQRSLIELALDRTPLTATEFKPRLVAATTRDEGALSPAVVATAWNVVHPANRPDAPTGDVLADLPADTLASRVKVTFAGADPKDAALELTCAAR